MYTYIFHAWRINEILKSVYFYIVSYHFPFLQCLTCFFENTTHFHDTFTLHLYLYLSLFFYKTYTERTGAVKEHGRRAWTKEHIEAPKPQENPENEVGSRWVADEWRSTREVAGEEGERVQKAEGGERVWAIAKGCIWQRGKRDWRMAGQKGSLSVVAKKQQEANANWEQTEDAQRSETECKRL